MTVISKSIALQIQTLEDAGFGYKKIAKQLDLKAGTVKKHIRKKKSIAGLEPKIKVYKGKLQGRYNLAIKQYITEHPFATLEQTITALNLPVSTTTLHRYLKHYGLDRKIAKRQVVLSEANRRKRLEFAKKLVEWSDEKLASILWSDETKVQAWPNGEIVFYRAPGNVAIVTPRKQNGGGGVMFWGCMSHHAWGPLVVCQGTINGAKYLDILKDYVVPEIESSPERLIFQQDNAPAHKKREIIEFLEAQDFETLDWPPQSPDLSPIEWIWNNIKMKMKALDPRPRTPATIREAILDIWENLDDNCRIKTCDTFRKRLRECIANKGGFTRF
jgi:transposase